MFVRWETDTDWMEFRDPIRLLKAEGLGVSDVTVISERVPLVDGEVITGERLEAREVTFEIVMIGDKNKQAEYRRRLVAAFNPRKTGTLTVDLGDGTRYVLLKAKAVEVTFPGKVGDGVSPAHQMAIVVVRAGNPFLATATEYEVILAGIFGGWSFLFQFPLSFGTIGKRRTVQNLGDVDAPLLIKCRGVLENVTLRNHTTGERIVLNFSIPQGGRVEINTAPGEKSVWYYPPTGSRVNAFQYISADSTLFLLKPGNNDLEYSATTEGQGALFVISYRYWYLGV